MTTTMNQILSRLEPEPIVLAFYRKAHREWQQELEAEQDRQRQLLDDPNYLASLGLPTVMPAESLDILKVALAADKVGPKMPKISTYDEKFGQ